MGRKGIRVNVIGPAYVTTEMTQHNIATRQRRRSPVQSPRPDGPLAQPADVADTVSFLLRDKTSFITGHPLRRWWLAYGYF